MPKVAKMKTNSALAPLYRLRNRDVSQTVPQRTTPLKIMPDEPQIHPRTSLLGLPVELRSQILTYAFADVKSSKEAQGLLTCRKIYHEAADFAFCHSAFCLQPEYWGDVKMNNTKKIRIALAPRRRRMIKTIRIKSIDGKPPRSYRRMFDRLHNLQIHPKQIIFDRTAPETAEWTLGDVWFIFSGALDRYAWTHRSQQVRSLRKAIQRFVHYADLYRYHCSLVSSLSVQQCITQHGYIDLRLTSRWASPHRPAGSVRFQLGEPIRETDGKQIHELSVLVKCINDSVLRSGYLNVARIQTS